MLCALRLELSFTGPLRPRATAKPSRPVSRHGASRSPNLPPLRIRYAPKRHTSPDWTQSSSPSSGVRPICQKHSSTYLVLIL